MNWFPSAYFALALATTTQAWASPAGLSALALSPQARAAAMGLTGTAATTGPAGALYNPALGAARHGVAVNSAYANWSGDVDHFVNSFSWAGAAGPVSLGGALTHSRLDFKSFEAALGYLPRNTQSSYMTATVSVRWSGTRGALAAGTSLAWDTSEDTGDDTPADFGISAEGPPLQASRVSLRYAVGFSSLRNGSDGVAAAGEHGFAPGAGAEEYRYGVLLAIAVGDVSATIQGDAVDAGQDGDDYATAAGVELSLLEVLHARAGYGDDILGGRSAVTLGAGAGRRIGEVDIRLDYARVETTDDALAANVFGAHIALDF